MIGKVKVVMLKGEKGDTGATGDYSGILNKPQINSVTLDGNKSASDLGLATAADQQNLIDTVSSLNDTVSDINDDITEINGNITELQTQAAGRPYIVTADYNATTRTFSNPSATAAEIYAAINTSNRPCYMVGNDSNGGKVCAVCVSYSSTVAIFSMTIQSYVFSYILINSTLSNLANSFDTLPLVVTADYVSSTRTMSNFSATAEEIWSAVKTYNRPCFLYGISDGNTRFVASCVYVTYSNGTYTATFSKSSDGNEDTWRVTDGVGGTTATHYGDFAQGVFSAESGVTAAESFYRKGMVYALNFSASGTFSSGITTLGTYSGLDINTSGLGGVCLLLTGLVNNIPTYTTGYFTLAANGELIVVSNAAYYGVKINLSYIWPF